MTIPETTRRDGRIIEAERMAVLAAHDPAVARNDAELIAITGFAARLCDAPIALVSLVEEDRQWFPARHGLAVTETPRSTSFCAHAMLGDGIMIVPDATADPRFAANPLVTGAPHIRFYAGAPLVTAEGVPFGALCVIDERPRAGLTDLQRHGLTTLALGVMTRLQVLRAERRRREEGRRFEDELLDQEQRFQVLADTMPQMVWSTLPDGFHDYYNARWYEFTGMPRGSTDGEAWNGMFHPEDQERAWAVWRDCLATGKPYEIEYRLRAADGAYRWVLGRALPMRAADGTITRWFGTCTDIHDQKVALEQREVVAHELSHRIKNIFSVIGGLIGFSTRANPEFKQVAAELRDRLMALGRAHDFVRPHSELSRPTHSQTSLHGMLAELLSPYQSGDRILILGDDPEIDDQSATPFALLFHELATNAAKYGALSAAAGTVCINITSNANGVTLRWTEQGGPDATRPATDGFGTRLMELSAVKQLGGRLDRSWLPAGLTIDITIPHAAMKRPLRPR